MGLPPRHHAPLPAKALPRELAPMITSALEAVNQRLQLAYAATADEQRDIQRSDGGWSVNQVLEHIARTNEAYLKPMTELADKLSLAPVSDVTWRSTFAARWLASSLTMTIPLPAPKKIEPGPDVRDEVVKAVITSHEEVCALMRRVAAKNWRLPRMVSPLSAMVRPNFGDACVVVLRHSERHTAQIENLVAELQRLAQPV